MTTTEKVTAILREADLGKVTRVAIAESLGMSVSAMHDHLGKDGVNYSDLLDAERMRRCQSIMERYGRRAYAKRIQDEVGFYCLNSFYRAFKRWTGQRFSDVRTQQ